MELACVYKGTRRSDPALLHAAALARSLKMDLAVVVPFVIPADGPGCCGIRGQRWVDMLRQVAEDDADRARQLLEHAGVPHSVAVAEGASVREIVHTFTAYGDRELALPKSASGTGFARSDLRRIKHDAAGPVRALP